MQKEFLEFIKKHHVLNICACEDNTSWSASCFYSFLEKDNLFIFASDKKTKHIQMIEKNPNISGTITLETNKIGLIQGIQFSGFVEPASTKSKMHYLKTFPYAIALNPILWEIKITYAKLTDNILGFGHKLEFKG